MNIALLIPRLHLANGAERQTEQVARELARRGHDVTIFTRRYRNQPFAERKDDYRIKRRRELPLPAVRMVWDTLAGLWHIARHRPKVDVLLCYQTLNSGLIGAIAQSVLGIPAILSVRGTDEYRLDFSMTNRVLVPRIYRQVKHVVVQSPRILKDLHAQWKKSGKSNLYQTISSKLSVIPNGVGLTNLKQVNGSKVVYVGRLIKDKGVADLILALKQLRDVHAVIVGDGPDRQRLEQIAHGLPIAFAGRVQPSAIPSYLNQARMMVLPSHHGDGMPNVILEAMTCGVPVVTTRTSAMPDLIRHEENGLLFEPGDVRQLAQHIGRLNHDHDLWSRLGKRSLEVAKTYSWDNVTPQIEELLTKTVNNGSPRGC